MTTVSSFYETPFITSLSIIHQYGAFNQIRNFTAKIRLNVVNIHKSTESSYFTSTEITAMCGIVQYIIELASFMIWK
ncbi:hypothetical protein PMSD_05415 [Paenibacillus macquariensis subsp. defensor]|nr:hypothetical protein PMSD_05415 [Paenibacillus macquariensis subsp. defensor]